MKELIKNFFSTSNEINENTVFAVVSFGLMVAAIFLPFISADKFYALCGFTAACLGVGALKK